MYVVDMLGKRSNIPFSTFCDFSLKKQSKTPISTFCDFS